MRWERLFADLEAQLTAAEAAELAAEVADRTRRELALVALGDRLRAARGLPLLLTVSGCGPLQAGLRDVGPDWLLAEDAQRRDLLVPTAALLAVRGLGAHAEGPGQEPAVSRRLDLRWALRGLVRDRAGVAVQLRDGTLLSGTLDRVGADHVDVAEHPAGEARRAPAVRQVTTVPLPGLAVVRSG